MRRQMVTTMYNNFNNWILTVAHHRGLIYSSLPIFSLKNDERTCPHHFRVVDICPVIKLIAKCFFPHLLSDSEWRFFNTSFYQRWHISFSFRLHCLFLKSQWSTNVHSMFQTLDVFLCSFGSQTKCLTATRHTDHTKLRWYYSQKNLACLRCWYKFAPATWGKLKYN